MKNKMAISAPDCGNGTKKRRKQEKRRNSASSLRGRRSKGEGNQGARPRAPNFPLPLPLLTPATHYSGRSARSSEDGRGGERKESLPTRFKFLLLLRPVPSHASAPLLPPLGWKEAETTTQATWPLPQSWSSRLNIYIFCFFVGFASLCIDPMQKWLPD